MAVIALNWEIGADLGHIGRLLPLAQRLRDEGHRPVLLLRDLSRAEVLLGSEGLEYLQAPLWILPPAKNLPPDLNFTETLCRFGYLEPAGLLAMCRAWRALWSLIRPDLLVFDMAPTAMLAARGIGLPTVALGTSFSIPPQLTPLPPYRFWSTTEPDMPRLRQSEQRVMRSVNAVLQRLEAPVIRQVSELFDADRVFLNTFAALDVYGHRRREVHIGAIGGIDQGVEPEWPTGGGRKVFAYLKPDSRHFAPMLAAIAAREENYLIFAPGIPERSRLQLSSERVRISTTPLRIRSGLRECSAFIGHGGGMTAGVLAQGCPVLLLPMQLEQLMTSVRVDELNAGLFLPTDGDPKQLPGMLERLLSDDTLREAAAALAADVAAVDPQAGIDALVAACDELLGDR